MAAQPALMAATARGTTILSPRNGMATTARPNLSIVADGKLDKAHSKILNRFPRGWVATMNAPLNEEVAKALSNTEKLERQAQEEVAWFSKLLGAGCPKDNVGCNALLGKMKDSFHKYVRETWAPATLYRLNKVTDELTLQQRQLGSFECLLNCRVA